MSLLSAWYRYTRYVRSYPFPIKYLFNLLSLFIFYSGDMRAHLANKHASEYSYVCKREADSQVKAVSCQTISFFLLLLLFLSITGVLSINKINPINQVNKQENAD